MEKRVFLRTLGTTLLVISAIVFGIAVFHDWRQPDAQAQQFIRSGTFAETWGCGKQGLVASLTECQAVPADSTDRYYITDIAVQTTTGTSGTFAIRSGTGTNCATGTAAVFPSTGTSDLFNAPINSQPIAHLHFITPLRPTAGHAICVIGTAVNTIDVELRGFKAK